MSNPSPSQSVDPTLTSLLASARLSDAQLEASGGSTGVATSPLEVARDGKSPVSFLSSLDAVALGGGLDRNQSPLMRQRDFHPF